MTLLDIMLQSWEGIAVVTFFGGLILVTFLLPVCDACMERREAIKKFFKELFE